MATSICVRAKEEIVLAVVDFDRQIQVARLKVTVKYNLAFSF
jgi:hypothetical protein